ncbi:ATP-dependent helicase C-terminal domain-containing protein, partial [uncultured Fibrobacter sp.]|uniref:helicase-related protein n=1 Tax=uncultured Fibrobacter sp. TaxID=261512 RepID=UPI0026141113
MNYNDLALAEEEGRLEAALAESRHLLIEAPTGSGKSLFIPWFLSKHCKGRVVVLQPRRIAALALAQFSAKLHGESCGKTVGYQFRQDSCKSAETRILFQTYGNFLQELLHGKLDADWIVFDEYHERKADMDLLFAYFRRENVILSEVEGSKSPRIAVMSAALNRSELETVLGVKCLSLGHPLYPVQIINQTPATGTSLVSGVGLDAEVVRALRTLYRNNIWQTTLVFLPGKAEIARCHTAAAEALGNNCAEFLELYGGQDRETQDRIFEVTEHPRVIFTTNIAETSITVPNVTGVVDSGIERVSLYDDSEKVNVLRTLPISMQNAIQRSGRSGRTQNGCAIRLWSEESEKRMPQGIVPEVLQIEPSELLLQKAALEFGVRNSEFRMDCHASNEARNDVKGECSETACGLIAEPHCHGATRNDENGYSTHVIARSATTKQSTEAFTCKQLFKAFPDRLATPSGNAYKLANQNVIRLQVAEPPYAILALSMLRTGTTKSELKVNLYAPISQDMLSGNKAKTRYELLWRSGQERFIGVEISESENADGSVTELSRKEILTQEASPKVLEELKKLTVDAWHEKIEKENWSGKFLTEAVQTLLIKMRLAAKLYPEYGLPEFNEEDMELIFDEFASGKFLLRDINEDRYRSIVEEYFGKSMLQWLGKTFPDHYTLPNGKRARYSYQEVATSDDGKSVQSIEGVLVEISARIEDFMQLRGEHKIADGKLKVRYDILAPNFRTIQKT